MKCPKCDQELQLRLIGTVEVEECEKCNGIWFDKDELRKCKDQTDQDLNWMDFELWKHKDRFRVLDKTVQCPKCHVNMVAINYDKTNVEIDHCIECEGVWLDGGDFQKIIESLTDELLTKSTLEYLRASLSEAKEIITGPEGFISEWRDFLTVVKFMQLRLFIENPKLTDTLTNLQRNNPIR